MATTVKSLEERADQMVDDVSSVVAAVDRLGLRMDNLTSVVAAMQSQLNAVFATVQATQTQLAVVVQRVDTVTTRLDQLDKKLDSLASAARLDQVEKKVETLALSYAAFEAKGEVTNKLLRWVGGLAALAIVSFIAFGYSLARHAGSLDEKVQHHQDTLNEVKRDIADIKTKLK